MKKTIVSFICCVCVLTASAVYAAAPGPSPDAYQTEALNDIEVAFRLMQQAKVLLDAETSRSNVKTAMDLYIQAGQLLEKAENIFKALGPSYVSQDDLANCSRSKNMCVETIKKLRGML